MPVPRPPDETNRQAALDRYQIVDSGYSEALTDIAKLAAFICHTPIGAVTLIDRDRQVVKASVGLETGETTRDDAFCAHTILQNDVMVIKDAGQDARFQDNPLVTGSPNIRFYAGAPLMTPDRFKIGSLCVIDRQPRTLAPEEAAALTSLSRLVMMGLELRRSSSELAAALKEIQTLGAMLPICSYCKDVRDDQGYWKRVEEYVGSRTGTDFSHGMCPRCAKIHFPHVFANR